MTLNPSSNWKALQKKLDTSSSARATKRRKLNKDDGEKHSIHVKAKETRTERYKPLPPSQDASKQLGPESLEVADAILHFDEESLSDSQRKPGKYLAVDCEMVGVGPEGEESSLARVSMVNFYGSVQLDIFVLQREKVTDWRTAVSGITPKHMSSDRAVSFAEAQKRVAELIKDRILVGHAIENDLKALLLSHPRMLVRDTQRLARKSKLLGGSRWPGLKKLIHKEFGVTIQAGQHDSVTDARATMALFRKYRKDWEKSQRPMIRKDKEKHKSKSKSKSSKPSLDDDEEEEGLEIKPKKVQSKKRKIEELEEHPGAGVKGYSSGLSTIIKRRDPTSSSTKKKAAWWSTLEPQSIPSTSTSGSKGSLRLQMAR